MRSLSPDLGDIARGIVARAHDGEAVEAYVSRGSSTSVRVYGGEIEAMTSGASAGVGVRVIVDGRQGFASAATLDPDVVAETLDQARTNAGFAEPDEYVGMIEPDGVSPPTLDLDDPAVREMSEDAKIDLALDLERRLLAADPRITGVRVVSWGDGRGEVAMASTAGIDITETGASCSVGVQPLATEGDETQIGYAGDGALRPADLDLDRVVREGVERAVGMLGATKPDSERLTVVLERGVASSFLGIVAGMLSGEQVLKGRSPFAERAGEVIAHPSITLIDDATDARSLGATPFDGEGLATRRTPLIDGGVLSAFLHNGYTARRSGAVSTASAVRGYGSTPGVGALALQVLPGDGDLDAVLAQVGDGFYVESVSGLHSGVNAVSGDFSVGATGRRIRGGALAEPLREATIASTIQRMLLDVVAVGGDIDWRPSGTAVPTVAIADVALSGV